MNRSRQGLENILGLLLGFFLGLATTWWIAPNAKIDYSPAALRDDYKDEYRLMVATTYTLTSDLGRARFRLALLGDENIVQTLVNQAIRYQTGQIQSRLFTSNSEENIYALALLANTIEQTINDIENTPTGAINSTIPIPTTTPKPYELISQETLCDPESTMTLVRIIVRNNEGIQQPGVEILITWDEGQESIFTGLKPHMGNGYADFMMKSSVSYTLQIMPSSLPVSNLSLPVCITEDGTAYQGGYLMQFQQP